MLRKLNMPFFEADTGKGSGGDGVEEIRAQVRKELEQEYAGLKANRDELLAEKRAMKEQSDAFKAVIEAAGGSDGIKALQELKTRLEKDEVGRLLTEGKTEEWFEKRTTRMRSEYDQQLKSANEQLETERKARSTAEKARTDLLLETAVRAAASKLNVVETAVSDAILRARGTFSFDPERGALVIKDENDGVTLGKDGKSPMAVEEWLEGQKESARHWFPASKGTGANGAHGNGAGPKDPSKMDWAEYAAYRKEMGMDQAQGIPG